MKLRDLGAKFIGYETKDVPPDQFIDGVMHPDGKATTYPWVGKLEDAKGICFKCPKCFGTKDTHSVICWFEGRVPDDVRPGPGRWNPAGTSLDDLSFVPGKHTHSVQLLGSGCQWHGFVTNGDAS